jgi:hypothetical protein
MMTAAAFVLPLLLLTAQDKKAPANPNAIPANAERIDEQTYKVKEKDGKTWVYRKTPFGVSRLAEEQFRKQEDAALIKPSSQAAVRVIDLGDEYKFERAYPFGVQVWKKKKSELTADEQGYVEKTKPELGPSSTTAKTAGAAKVEKKN